MPENLYSGEDSTVSRDNTAEKDLLIWTRMVLKRWYSFNQPANTTTEQGVAPTRKVTAIEISGKFRVMTGKDILSNGGTYQLGDLEIETNMPVYGPNNRPSTVTQNDELIMNAQTYSLVGKPWMVPGFGGTVKYMSTWRRSS